jgi:hypothetical protein
MAKQGKLIITLSNISGLVRGDTLATFLSTAQYYITIGSSQYVFVPTTVTTSGTSITVSYTLKDSALASSLAAELADNTSAATAVTAGFMTESQNYTFSDDYLARLFATPMNPVPSEPRESSDGGVPRSPVADAGPD